MSATRSTLLAGPAAVTWQGHTFFARDGILVTPLLDLAEVDSDAHGWLDATATAAPVSIRFTPHAPLADLAALFPHLDGTPGKPLFGATDTPLVLTAANGARLTFAAVALTQMPALRLAPDDSVAGSVTFLAIGARNRPLAAGNRLVVHDNGTIPLALSGTPQLADDFTASWAGAPWLNLRARDGITVRSTLHTRAVFSAAHALVDLTLEKLAVEVLFTPATPGGPAEIDLLDALHLQGSGSLPGHLLSTDAAPLTLAGDYLSLRLPEAQLIRGELAFDGTRGRLGELHFTATRALLEVPAPLAVLGDNAP